MRIVVDNKIPFLQGVFEPYAEVDYLDAKSIAAPQVKRADALIVRTRTACKADLLQNSCVKFIATATIGAEHIDSDFCAQHHIAWENAPGCNSGAVEQYVASALLLLAQKKNIVLRGKTMGIVGVGNVGKRVAELAKRLQLKLLLCDPPRAERENDNAYVSLGEIAQKADIITFHVPLTKVGANATYHLANQDFFGQIAKNPILINASRGEVIDEMALRVAIDAKKIQACALDVWENEPFIDERTLRRVDIGTPHIAGYSAEGKAKASEMAVQAVGRFFDLPLQNWQHPALPPVEREKDASSFLKTSNNFQHFLYRFYQNCYPILLDDSALRAQPHQGEELRNHYHLRREPTAQELQLVLDFCTKS